MYASWFQLQEEPQKLQGEYEKLKEKFNLEKVKYDEVHAKGKPGSKYDDAKARLCKAGMKLHKMHNDYLLSLREVSLHQQFYLNTTLPGLLNYQQEVQEAMVNQRYPLPVHSVRSVPEVHMSSACPDIVECLC